MKKYKDYAPTGFDTKGSFLPDQQDWLVAPVILTRDSTSLEESNFAIALHLLGGESEDVQIHRFGHWACGWFEIIIVHPRLEKEAQEIEDRLENYPILDESDYSDRQWRKASEYYDSLSIRERWNDWLQKEDLPIWAARYPLSELLRRYEADKVWEHLTCDD